MLLLVVYLQDNDNERILKNSHMARYKKAYFEAC
jgi:hypothetical protein